MPGPTNHYKVVNKSSFSPSDSSRLFSAKEKLEILQARGETGWGTAPKEEPKLTDNAVKDPFSYSLIAAIINKKRAQYPDPKWPPKVIANEVEAEYDRLKEKYYLDYEQVVDIYHDKANGVKPKASVAEWFAGSNAKNVRRSKDRQREKVAHTVGQHWADGVIQGLAGKR
ncbi:MAG: hypothetical protein Q9166_005307 [cf. Caloplaca sp. 2 TL-2023]